MFPVGSGTSRGIIEEEARRSRAVLVREPALPGGAAKTSRKGYAVTVGHTNTLIFDEPKHLALDLEATLAGNLDRLPDYQNVAVDIDSFRSVVNTLGGVVVDVQIPVSDPKYPTNDGRGSMKLLVDNQLPPALAAQHTPSS